MRVRRRQLAEEKAAKTAVQLIFPLVLFIFPAIFVILLAPAVFQMMKSLGSTPAELAQPTSATASAAPGR